MKTTLAVMLLTCCTPGILAAQPSTSPVPSPSLPRWDTYATFQVQDLDLPDSDSHAQGTVAWYAETPASLRINVGRYWTTHLKTELSINPATVEVHGSEIDVRSIAGGQPISTYTQRDGQVSRLTFDGLYQFGDNAFTHPYVSTGLSLDIIRTRRYRYAETRSVRVGSQLQAVVIDPIDDQFTSAAAGLHTAVGAKCYFNRKVFARPEATWTWTPGSNPQSGVSFGFGIDF